MPGKSQSPPVDRRLLTRVVAFEKSSSAATLLSVQLLVDRAAFTCKALIDSGAEGNFLDHFVFVVCMFFCVLFCVTGRTYGSV